MLRLLLAEKACVPQTQMLSQLQAQGGVSQAMLAASAGMPASAGLNHEAALQVGHRVTWSVQTALCTQVAKGDLEVHALLSVVPAWPCNIWPAALVAVHRWQLCRETHSVTQWPKAVMGSWLRIMRPLRHAVHCALWHVQGCSFEALCTSISNIVDA